MAIRLAVGPQTLNLVAQVRILDRQPDLAPSSSGLGHHPLKVAARVQIPLGVLHSDDNALLYHMYAVNPHIVRHHARVKARLARKVP